MFDHTQSTANNDGGHKTIVSLIPLADVDAASIPALVGAPAANADYATLDAGDIVAVSTKKWFKLTTQIEKVGSAISSEGSAGSINMVSNPKIRFENLTAGEIGLIQQLKSQPVLLVLEDMNGVQWLYGNEKLPCYVSEISGDFGTALADDKFIEVSFRNIADPVVYPGSISYVAVA